MDDPGMMTMANGCAMSRRPRFGVQPRRRGRARQLSIRAPDGATDPGNRRNCCRKVSIRALGGGDPQPGQTPVRAALAASAG
jgi:hypothetical protein